jgi:hypothetical protein
VLENPQVQEAKPMQKKRANARSSFIMVLNMAEDLQQQEMKHK